MKNTYRTTTVKGMRVLVHRLVWEKAHGPIPDGMVIDHINGVRYDNRLENLRCISQRKNLLNTNAKCWEKHGSRYRAYTHVNRRKVSLGTFDTSEEAEDAVKKYKQSLLQEGGVY